MATFAERMVGAARLEVRVYEEVEADPTAMGQAMGVVVLSSIAAGLGSGVGVGMGTLLIGAIGALVGWFIWAFLTYFIGTKLLPQSQTEADLGQLLRTIGFSSSPGLLRVFGVVPTLGGLVVLVAEIWMLAAMVVAVRQALDYTSTWRAIGVCVVGWIVLVVISAVIFGLG
ncbi:MAG: YIP1 family protein [Gemmatimonadales bacterium]